MPIQYFRLILIEYILLIVITDPYKGLKYNQINVYTFDKKKSEKVMEIIEPEEEKHFDDYLERKYGEKWKDTWER